MAKILFVNPVIRENEKPVHIPYGLAQLVALVLKKGHRVQVFDANAFRPTDKEICNVLAADRWDVIATGGLITTYGFIKKIVNYARKIQRGSLIIVGGGFITPLPYEVMNFLPGIDIGVIGEGYITLLEILDKLDDNDFDWEEVKGIIYRDKKREIHLNEARSLLDDVDSLPFPAWHLFPVSLYFRNSGILLSEEAMLSKRNISIMASYGCPFTCKYCFHLGLSGELKIVGLDGNRQVVIDSDRKARFHSPQYIVDLIKYAKIKFGIDFISFIDENFINLARKENWFDEFARLWEKAALIPRCIKKKVTHHKKDCKGIHWGASAHAALVNLPLLEGFKELGCSYLDYGLESFSDDILKSIGKGANARLNETAITATLQAGIRPIPNQIIGFPDESFESILTNMATWRKLGIRSYPFFATPYPGSEWYFTYKDKILSQYNGNLENFLLELGDATKITAVISKNFNAVELLALRELMVNGDIKRIMEYKKIKSGYVNNRTDILQ